VLSARVNKTSVADSYLQRVASRPPSVSRMSFGRIQRANSGGVRPTRLGRCHRDDEASGDGVPKRIMPWVDGRDQQMASR
jgi:hypothetical protein